MNESQLAQVLQARLSLAAMQPLAMDLHGLPFAGITRDDVEIPRGTGPFNIFTLGNYRDQYWEVITLQGAKYPAHIHDHVATRFYMVCGQGLLFLNHKPQPYQPGNVLLVGKGVSHAFYQKAANNTALTAFLSVQLDDNRIHDTRGGKDVLDFRPDKSFVFPEGDELDSLLRAC